MKKILIVDDEALILYSLSAVLRNEHTEVKTASTGSEACRELSRASYDLCFFDLHLPDKSGLDLMQAVRERSPGTKIIMMTADEMEEKEMNYITESGALLVTKPFDVFQLKELAERALAEQAAALQDYESFEKWLRHDRRHHERQLVTKTISYAVVTENEDIGIREHIADIIDVSDGGMGIRIDRPIEPDRVLAFANGNGKCIGSVRWVMVIQPRCSYRAGIQFR